MKLLDQPKRWVAAVVLLTVVAAAASALLPRGLALAAVSDTVDSLLLLVALFAFARNGLASSGRARWFWMLQAAGWALWFSDQVVWVVWDLVLQRKMPAMYPSDALLFLSGAPMFAGLLLRPHRQPAERNGRVGALDFLLLLSWWLYLYVSFVVCWQYVSPNEDLYNRNFDLLSGAGTFLLACVLGAFWRQSSGAWRTFYAWFLGAVVFNGMMFYLIDYALEKNTYFTGSWYDIPYSMSFALFTCVAVVGRRLTPESVTASDESYDAWLGNLAMIAVLSLPIIAFYALLDKGMPRQASDFRVLVTLATMFILALLLFLQHHRLNGELRRANLVLHEASLTDPLTGLRNRRHFLTTIEGDVSQTLRSYSDGHDLHTRDLVFYLIDADNFKEVNDRYGHAVGDQVLVEMARRLSSSIRHSDVLVRWGGEEFLIVSRYTDRGEAGLLAERVLSAVADTPFCVGGSGEVIYRTCSVGWAPFPWFCHDPSAIGYEEVVTLADRGLQQAKRANKNCAVGMLPATGKLPPLTIEGLHSEGLQVDTLAVAGPGAKA